MSSTVQAPDVRSLRIGGQSDRENISSLSSHQGDSFSGSAIRPVLVGPNDIRRAPFDGFVSAAFSALLAVLLAWRFLLFSDERAQSDKHGGSIGVDSDEPSVIVGVDEARRAASAVVQARIKITPSTEKRPKDTVDDCDQPPPAPTIPPPSSSLLSSSNPLYEELDAIDSDPDSVIMADSEDAIGDATGTLEDFPPPAAITTSNRPEHDDENCMHELCSKCDDIEPTATDDNQRDSSLRSVRKLLPTDVLVVAPVDDDDDDEEDDNLDEIERVFFSDRHNDMMDSDLSDQGPLPPYLDTITEVSERAFPFCKRSSFATLILQEDSDDLRSQSSCSSQLMSRSAAVRAADSLAIENGDVRAYSVSPAIPIYVSSVNFAFS